MRSHFGCDVLLNILLIAGLRLLICLKAMVGLFAIERAHIKRIAIFMHQVLKCSIAMHCFWPSCHWFFLNSGFFSWWYCDIYSPSSSTIIPASEVFILFSKVSSLQRHLMDVSSWSTCLLQYYVLWCHTATAFFSWFQVFPVGSILCFIPFFRRVRFSSCPYNKVSSLQCRRHLRMWSI